MLVSSISRTVDFCARHAWWVILGVLALASFSAVYAVQNFAVKTDVKDLFPRDLAWTQRALDFVETFPQPEMLVVVDAPTPEFADQAAAKLADALSRRKNSFHGVYQMQGGPFFERSGLLYVPANDLRQLTDGFVNADPLLQTLAADPSLRGALAALDLGLMGVQYGQIQLDDLERPMTMASHTVEDALSGRPASFSWRALTTGGSKEPQQLYRFIEVQPVLDYSALEPGQAAGDAVMRTSRDLHLDRDYQARVRLTGLVPMNDAQFATIRESAPLTTAVSVISVLVILWLALRSGRIIVPVAINLAAGLAISAAFGLFVVGALNVISIAFFVLFIGLGVDFGLQLGVRYRAERHEFGALRVALRSAARKAGPPLALAAAATAVGFSSFLPTSYRGLSELGEIAGGGMIIAFLTSITLLPALLTVMKPPPEPRPMGFAALAPVDRFIREYRIPVVVATLAIVALASPLLLSLRFDFNPLHLRNPQAAPMATFLELRRDAQTGANAIDIAAPNSAAAHAIAERVAALPQVARTMTLEDLIPHDQPEKLQLITAAAGKIAASLNPGEIKSAPTDAENVAALSSTAGQLSAVAGGSQGPGATAAGRLAGLLSQLAEAKPSIRAEVERAFVEPLRFSLDQLRAELAPQQITVESLPAELKRMWLAPDGQFRVQVLPKADPDDTAALRQFVTAVLTIEPTASGPAVLMYEAGNTVVHAFVEAGVFALVGIAILLVITLRRMSDVLLTLVPLLVAGVVTLELCVAFDIPLNFANIIALPLLLGVGVAFKIYYIMAWRSGKTALVQSTLTRAVIFSALTTASAFGSLWLSRDPATSSMGQLMALALVCTMAAAVLFQPALMGRPRTKPTWVVRREASPAVGAPAGSRIPAAAPKAHALAGVRASEDERA